jgi:hypothetical protein
MPTNLPQNAGTPAYKDDTRLVPWWSVMLAIGAFVGWQFVTFRILVPLDPRPKPFPLMLFWSIFIGVFFAFYMLMIGYVNRDAKRRGMSPTFWTIIMLFLLASGIGFIVYFLLRQPLVQNCPKCMERVESDFNFCPRCHFELNAMCGECHHAVRAGDIYCAHCGSVVEAPSLVRAR